jgi:hypothetical protein
MPANDVPQAKTLRASIWGCAAAQPMTVPIVEDHRGETRPAEPFRERGESSGLDCADAVRHHHGWMRPISFGEVQPGFQLVAGRGAYPHGGASRDGGSVSHIRHHRLVSQRGVCPEPALVR